VEFQDSHFENDIGSCNQSVQYVVKGDDDFSYNRPPR
jgi:hypothetical protein